MTRGGGASPAPLAAIAGALIWVAGATSARAQALPGGFSDQPMVSGLSEPVGMAFLPDGRLLVTEQRTATIQLLIPGAISTISAIGTVPEVNAGGAEQGLLGIAVDPGWPTRSFVYVHYDHAGDAKIRISRFLVTGDVDFSSNRALAISPTSRYDLLIDAPDTQPNHNGGTLRFGPDGMLYASLGEDGNRCAAQDSVSLHGVILRLDVSRLPTDPGGPAPKALIAAAGNPFAAHPDSNARLVWALGLRNPFRFHIDAPTGDVVIADVGEQIWEEIDLAASGGLNFGWPHYEGPAPFNQSCPDANTAFVAPIHAFDRRGNPAAIVGAGLYRRPAGGAHAFPTTYDGDYFFSDYYIGFVRRLVRSGDAWSMAPPVPGQPTTEDWATGLGHVSDWLMGPTGALWYCKQSNDLFEAATGEVRRIVYTAGAPPVIASVQATPGEDGRSATLQWQTDVTADSRVEYGIQPGVLDRSVTQSSLVLDHVLHLAGLSPETVYFFRVLSASASGASAIDPGPKSPPYDFVTSSLTPTTRLLQPFPSPSIGRATVAFELDRPATVTMRIYDCHGRLVRTLIGDQARGAGGNTETWDGREDDGRDAPAGIYVVRLGVEGSHLERRLAMVR